MHEVDRVVLAVAARRGLGRLGRLRLLGLALGRRTARPAAGPRPHLGRGRTAGRRGGGGSRHGTGDGPGEGGARGGGRVRGGRGGTRSQRGAREGHHRLRADESTHDCPHPPTSTR
ncbi:hypothetical protein D5H75_38815 [Bailinhaonella thermotolerans]|uniref:Uncharacterized protein n=1 Tax=Bailinhaonella thermotolerans TaxID=1070861 RepID=A0A3A4A185_9ACTN|nr:hypothetical protein D5H75_38815 [Bailinhaonella thermotolerans]